MPSDSDIIQEVLGGQPDSFAVLVTRYERLARATAIRIVRDSHVADDVAQESFVAAFKSLSALRDRSNFGGWLLGIVKKRAATAVQRERRRPIASAELSEHAASQEPTCPSSETFDLLEMLEQLPDQERVVIGLKYFDGHTAEQIAEMLDRPVGTVTKQLSRARRRLHGWLSEEVSEHEQTTTH